MWALRGRGAAPASFTSAAAGATIAIMDAVARGATKLSFRGYVYGSDDVRSQLNGRQHGKCAFCEVKVLPASTPHVEHFRPKAAVKDEVTENLKQPGYYWLAYCWCNLMLACPRCNSNVYKGSRFPLVDESHRATGPLQLLSRETPLLIDPYLESPRDYIRFRGAVAYAIDGNVRGITTINILGLNREDLIDARAEHLDDFFRTAAAASQLPEGTTREAHTRKVTRLLEEAAPFRSCLEDALIRARD